jgi:hypothetical protein
MQVPAERYPLVSFIENLGEMFSAKTGKSIRFWPARVPGRYNITWATETFIIPCATASLPPIGGQCRYRPLARNQRSAASTDRGS